MVMALAWFPSPTSFMALRHRTSTTGSSRSSFSSPGSSASEENDQIDGPAFMRKVAGNEMRKTTTINPINRNGIMRRISGRDGHLFSTRKVRLTVAQDPLYVKTDHKGVLNYF